MYEENNKEAQKAFDALNQSTDYISVNTFESVSASLYSEFQALLTFGLLRLILKTVDKPVEFLETIKESWKTRCSGFLNSEQKRFEDVMIQAAASENKDKKLPDSLSNILNNYNMILNSAFEKTQQEIDNLINSLVKNETTEKGNKK